MINRLKSVDAYWSPTDEITPLIMRDPATLNEEELRKVVRELDRRFMQLWDKVGFEAKHKLVDYSKLTPIKILNGDESNENEETG